MTINDKIPTMPAIVHIDPQPLPAEIQKPVCKLPKTCVPAAWWRHCHHRLRPGITPTINPIDPPDILPHVTVFDPLHPQNV